MTNITEVCLKMKVKNDALGFDKNGDCYGILLFDSLEIAEKFIGFLDKNTSYGKFAETRFVWDMLHEAMKGYDNPTKLIIPFIRTYEKAAPHILKKLDVDYKEGRTLMLAMRKGTIKTYGVSYSVYEEIGVFDTGMDLPMGPEPPLSPPSNIPIPFLETIQRVIIRELTEEDKEEIRNILSL